MEILIKEIKDSLQTEISYVRDEIHHTRAEIKELKADVKELNKVRWKFAGIGSVVTGFIGVVGYLGKLIIEKYVG